MYYFCMIYDCIVALSKILVTFGQLLIIKIANLLDLRIPFRTRNTKVPLSLNPMVWNKEFGQRPVLLLNNSWLFLIFEIVL